MSRCDWESANVVEQEADLFAANLLMPRERFLRRAGGVQAGLGGILRLTEIFGTSLTSTAVRYAECDAGACAVVKWNWGGVSWKKLSSATFAGRFGRMIEERGEVLPDSPTGRALAGEQPGEKGYFEAVEGTDSDFETEKD